MIHIFRPRRAPALAAAACLMAGCATAGPSLARSDEPRLANVRQLTRGGENAEAYFSADGTRLIFQATRAGETRCGDQMYVMELASGASRRITGGEGRTTCGYFFPSGGRVLYSSTHEAAEVCGPRPDYSRGYVWALYDHDIFTANPDGSGVSRLTRSPGYDAEATISPDGRTIVFTSVRDGDLDLYAMDADGGNVRRLTAEVGYDGGAFFSPDGSRIVYRAHHPTDAAEIADYQALLRGGLIRPTRLEIFVMNADGTGRRQVTRNGAANFAPYFHPDGERIIFSSNQHNPRGRDFDLYLVGIDGSGLERVTTSPEFDGFPMFSRDGRRLVFGSNRNAATEGETNVFIADWVDAPAR